MRPMTDLQMVVAVDEQGGFAKNGEIPWNYKEDWEHFKNVTKNSVCIMGRKTYEDALSRKKNPDKVKKILPGRDSYVITRQTDEAKFKGVEGIKSSVRQVMDKLPADGRNIFVLGGEKLYIEHIVWASRVFVTVVPGIHNCTRFFPVDYLANNFLIAEGREEGELKFVTYHRKVRRKTTTR